MEAEVLELLAAGLREFDGGTAPGAIAALLRHVELVSEWNQRMNLTSVSGPEEVVVKHILDSASVLRVFKLGDGDSVLDVGAGAGFPGVVLKALVPGIRLVLLESLAKRCRFLEEVSGELAPLIGGGASRAFEVVWGRAEDVARLAGYREAFWLVTARAVAELRVLSEYCLPFCRVGGEFVALKGPGVEEELAAAERAIGRLGGELVQVDRFELPFGHGKRTLVRVRKVRPGPVAYPRKAGVPSKSPL